MIIVNGTIQVKTNTGGGMNYETGHPNPPDEVVFGEPIECQYIVNKYNALAKSQGEHITQAEYQVLIEEQPFDAKQIRLKDKRTGKTIGDFSIRHIEPLEAVCQIRLWI